MLDDLISHRQTGEPLPMLRESDPQQAEALQPLLEVVDALAMLRPVTLPTAEEQVADQYAFLAEISRWQIQAVSPTWLGRLKRWITTQRWQFRMQPTTSRKENPIMTHVFAKLVVAFVLFFGSVGGVAAASTTSLPDSTLYPVKLALEDAQLALTHDPTATTNLYLSLAQERIEEMTTMAAEGQDPGAATVLRLEQHLQNALVAAAQVNNDATLTNLLTQTQQTIQTQTQALAQIPVNASTPVQNRLSEAQMVCSQFLGEVASGLQDPALFRERHTHNRPEDAPTQPQMTPGPNGTVTSVGTPHSGGPGDGTPICGNCTPTGDAHQYGPQPDQPGPGQPGGNPNATPQPTGTAQQNGPQPTSQPGPGQPGGNPNATPQPTGTAQQNGPQPTSQPGPGQPGGNPNATPQPTGTAQQNGPQPTNQPGPGQPGGNPSVTSQPTGTAQQNGPQPPHQPGLGQPGGNPNATPQLTCTAQPTTP
jgi:hypothetical protein